MRREVKFFEDVARRYGSSLEAEGVSEGVRRYRELFFCVGEGVEKGERGGAGGNYGSLGDGEGSLVFRCLSLSLFLLL